MRNKKYLKNEEWVGAKVRSKHAMRNACASLPAGTLFEVEHKWGRLFLRSEPCAHCGVSVRINKIPLDWVDLIELRPVSSQQKGGL